MAAGVISANGITIGLVASAVNLAAAGLILLLLPGMRKADGSTTRFLGHTAPLMVFFLYYKECGLILARHGVEWRDTSLAAAESALQQVMPEVPAAAGEVLAASYMSYIPFIFVAAILVFCRDSGARRLETLVRRIAFAWALCFTAFILFPVLGPRFADVPAQEALLGPGPFGALALFNQRYGMLHGGSFPSAHIAASVIALGALTVRARVLFLPLVLSIFVAVIALRYHYRIDVVVGVAVGLGTMFVDRMISVPNARTAPALAEP